MCMPSAQVLLLLLLLIVIMARPPYIRKAALNAGDYGLGFAAKHSGHALNICHLRLLSKLNMQASVQPQGSAGCG